MAKGPGKTSRAAVRARTRKIRPRKRGGGPWYWVIGAVVVLGVVLIVLTKSQTSEAQSPLINDHWHAALGVNVCGTWISAPPEFEAPVTGIHSHGDGLLHIHPFDVASQGKNANVGLFFKGGGWKLSENEMTLWDGTSWKDGAKCGDKPGRIVWKAAPFQDWQAGDVPYREGNPAKYAPKNGDIVAIGFLPEGVELTEPPEAEVDLASTLGADTVFGSSGSSTTTTAGTGTTTTVKP